MKNNMSKAKKKIEKLNIGDFIKRSGVRGKEGLPLALAMIEYKLNEIIDYLDEK